ncbi:AzlD domain-containing protein [Parvibaculum sp.]|uniref:AzlD domain-containing protein n=1 Tax=Parvibaculum sp. TaxID=2024848 RepID=UPI000C8DCE61|nr:AzlD domain-containing protein [Parvibaculum sp.]MAB12585.1 branched-chain amino acid ABC transporter permease [Parvibaculum sp.]
MSTTTLWFIVLAAGLGTFALRLSFIQLADRIALPRPFIRALRFVPAAVLSAIILPAVLRLPDGTMSYAFDNPRLLAAIGATLIAWATRNALVTILGGMALFWLLGWLI